jgi:hypothetical protein
VRDRSLHANAPFPVNLESPELISSLLELTNLLMTIDNNFAAMFVQQGGAATLVQTLHNYVSTSFDVSWGACTVLFTLSEARVGSLLPPTLCQDAIVECVCAVEFQIQQAKKRASSHIPVALLVADAIKFLANVAGASSTDIKVHMMHVGVPVVAVDCIFDLNDECVSTACCCLLARLSSEDGFRATLLAGHINAAKAVVHCLEEYLLNEETVSSCFACLANLASPGSSKPASDLLLSLNVPEFAVDAIKVHFAHEGIVLSICRLTETLCCGASGKASKDAFTDAGMLAALKSCGEEHGNAVLRATEAITSRSNAGEIHQAASFEFEG